MKDLHNEVKQSFVYLRKQIIGRLKENYSYHSNLYDYKNLVLHTLQVW
jgi:hypothetical protein